MKLTKPQGKELVRRHNLSVLSAPGEEGGPIAMPRGARIVCRRLRKLGLLGKSNGLTVAGVQKALELGGDRPENAEEWLDEQASRLQKVEKQRHDKVSDLIKTLAPVEDGGGSDLHDGDEEEFYELVGAKVRQLET